MVGHRVEDVKAKKLLMTVVRRFRAFAFTGILCAAAFSSHATECEYRIHYALRPANEVVWVSPPRDIVSSLPVTSAASAGSIAISLRLKRTSAEFLVAEFMYKNEAGVSIFLASIAVDEDAGEAYSGQVVQPDNGAVWALSLTPLCRTL